MPPYLHAAADRYCLLATDYVARTYLHIKALVRLY
jgi:hypothetical protein